MPVVSVVQTNPNRICQIKSVEYIKWNNGGGGETVPLPFQFVNSSERKNGDFLSSKNSLRAKKAGNLRGNKVRLNGSIVAMRSIGEPCTHTHSEKKVQLW